MHRTATLLARLAPELEADALTCTSACSEANSHPEMCRCVCGGANHAGHGRDAWNRAAAAMSARIAAHGGDPFLGQANDEEDWF